MPQVELGSERLSLAMALMVLAALACNLRSATPSPAPPTIESETPSPTSTPLPANTTLPETVPALVGTSSGENIAETPLPTFTPIQPPTLAPTLAASNTPIPNPTSSSSGSATRRPSATPVANAGPLTFDYHIEWRLKDVSSNDAIAKVTINASGGGGNYQYFRDELPVEGPIFEYIWRTCSGNPGSLRVTSADGQSVLKNYYENPPCPTSTPTP